MSNLLDGLDGIIDNNDSSVRRVVQCILFFSKNVVEQQALSVMQKIERSEAIPVRYNSNKHFYKQNEIRHTPPHLKNRKEAVRFTKEQALFHNETGLKIGFDSDGNYITKKDITRYTGHILSGKRRTIVNYTIAHIWGKTDNPLYFSLMWNYCLIPTPYAFLTDKKDAISLKVQNVIKAISIELYKPNVLMNNKVVDTLPETLPEEALVEAARMIKNSEIKFL
jgi:hypothetical protein